MNDLIRSASCDPPPPVVYEMTQRSVPLDTLFSGLKVCVQAVHLELYSALLEENLLPHTIKKVFHPLKAFHVSICTALHLTPLQNMLYWSLVAYNGPETRKELNAILKYSTFSVFLLFIDCQKTVCHSQHFIKTTNLSL